MTLTEFVRARLAEDEATARQAATLGADMIAYDNGERGDTWMSQAGDYDPARVLADVEAKRRIVEAFEAERVRRDIHNRSYDEGLLTTNDDLRGRLASNALCRGLEIAMLALAAVYADHPDYREGWKL